MVGSGDLYDFVLMTRGLPLRGSERSTSYRPRWGSGQPFIYAHLPIVVSLAAIGASISSILQDYSSAVPSYEAVQLFCGAVVVWLFSFFIVQHLSIKGKMLKSLWAPYATGIILIVLLSIWRLYPIIILGVVDMIFLIILLAELRVFKTISKVDNDSCL